jgi:ribose transport system substrate-binding protein
MQLKDIRRPRRALGTATLALTLAVTVSACSDASGDSGTDAEGAEGAVIGISWAHIRNSIYATETAELVKEAKRRGLQPMPLVDADRDPSKQISDVQTLLAQGAKGLVLNPVDSRAIGPAVEAAKNQGVPAVAPDVGINHPDTLINVTADQAGMGEQQCQAVGEAVASGPILYEAGDLSDNAGKDRWEGFSSCMEENFPDIEVTMKEAEWDGAEAASQVETVLTDQPDIKAIALASDSAYGPAVLATLKRMKKLVTADEPGHIHLSGIDGAPETADAVRAGHWDVMISQPVFEYAKYTIDYLIKGMEGEEIVEGVTDHDSVVRPDANGVLTDFLTAYVVTKDNVDDEKLWHMAVN